MSSSLNGSPPDIDIIWGSADSLLPVFRCFLFILAIDYTEWLRMCFFIWMVTWASNCSDSDILGIHSYNSLICLTYSLTSTLFLKAWRILYPFKTALSFSFYLSFNLGSEINAVGFDSPVSLLWLKSNDYWPPMTSSWRNVSKFSSSKWFKSLNYIWSSSVS